MSISLSLEDTEMVWLGLDHWDVAERGGALEPEASERLESAAFGVE
jgi:hypothetical protein